MGMAQEAEVTLYLNRISPFSQRVHLAHLEKCIQVKVVDIDCQNKPKELLEANPILGKDPDVTHDGNSVAESTVFLEYLENVWPDQVPLLPKNAVERAKIKFWCDYAFKRFTEILENLRMKSRSPEKSANIGENMLFLKILEETIARFSAECPFFTGEKFLLVDVILSPLVGVATLMKRVGVIPFPGPEEAPRLHKWMKAVSARPSFHVAVPTADEEMGPFRKIMERNAAREAAASRAAA